MRGCLETGVGFLLQYRALSGFCNAHSSIRDDDDAYLYLKYHYSATRQPNKVCLHMHEDIRDDDDNADTMGNSSRQVRCEDITSSDKIFVTLHLWHPHGDHDKTMENEYWGDTVTGMRMGSNCTVKLIDHDDGRGSCEKSGYWYGNLYTNTGRNRWCGQNFNDDVRIILFVTTKNNQELNENKINLIKSKVKQSCSPKHVPSKIIKVPEIPRTKSGKIVELAVRKIINGQEINNLEAISNPKSLDFFKNLRELNE